MSNLSDSKKNDVLPEFQACLLGKKLAPEKTMSGIKYLRPVAQIVFAKIEKSVYKTGNTYLQNNSHDGSPEGFPVKKTSTWILYRQR